MPELPEIVCRARQMNARLVGRKIRAVEASQPKCLNVPLNDFAERLRGATFRGVTNRGKWLVAETSRDYLLINLGMGGDILLVPSNALPKTWRVRLDLDGREALAVNFWWFGHVHVAARGRLSEHALSAGLGPNALDVTADQLAALLRNRRGGIKAFLLHQRNVAGIGNAYIHDILFQARLHPLREIPSLSEADVARLHGAIQRELERSIAVGGASYETDLDGKPGGFSAADLWVGYREGKPCPECGTAIEKIKTGATSSYVCPRCQPLAPPSPRKRATRSSAA